MASMRTEPCYFRTNYYTTIYNCTHFELLILFKIINVKFRNMLVNHKLLKNTTLIGTFPKIQHQYQNFKIPIEKS